MKNEIDAAGRNDVLYLNDFSGGLYMSLYDDNIPDNACVRFKGIHRLSGMKLRSRVGSPQVQAAHDADEIKYMLYNWFTSIGGVLYCAFTNNLGDNSGSSTDPFTFAAAPSSNSLTAKESSVYCCNGGTTVYAAVQAGCSDRNWGIAEPTTNCALAATTGGSMDVSSTYYYAYTFYNGSSGVESNPSPTNSVSLGAAQNAVNLSSIDVSGDSQVTARKIYRTVGNGGILYYLATISDNTTTTYADTTADSGLSDIIISYDNYAPIEGDYQLNRCYYFNGTMFWLEGVGAFTYDHFFFSNKYGPETIAGFNSVGNYLYDSPTCFCSWNSQLYCVCTQSVYAIVGNETGTNWEAFKVDGILGSRFAQSVVETPVGVLWMAGDGIRIFTGASQSPPAGGDALAHAYGGGIIDEIYCNAHKITCRATYARGEYYMGNVENILAYNVHTGRWRDLGMYDATDGTCNAIGYDVVNDRIYMNYRGNIVDLEDSTYNDGSDAIVFDIRTKRHSFGQTVVVRRIDIDADTNGNTVAITATVNGWSHSLGNLSTSINRQDNTFSLNAIGNNINIRIYCSGMTNTIVVHGIKIWFEVLNLRIIDAVEGEFDVPARLQDDGLELIFYLEGTPYQEGGKAYKYERYCADLHTNNYEITFRYKQVGGSATTIDTLQTASRKPFTGSLVDLHGTLEYLSFYHASVSPGYSLEIYDLTLHRTPVQLTFDCGEGSYICDGYFSEDRNNMYFRPRTKDFLGVRRGVYFLDYAQVYMDSNSNSMVFYLNTLDGTTHTIGTDSSNGLTYLDFPISKLGIMDYFRIAGDLTAAGGAVVSSVKVAARPLVLKVRLGSEIYSVNSYLDSSLDKIVFDFAEFPKEALNEVYFYERLVYDMDCGANSVEFKFDLIHASSTLDSGTITAASRSVDSWEIYAVGRAMELTLEGVSGDYFNIGIYNLELIGQPFTLDLYLNNQRQRIKSYMDGSTAVTFDLSLLEEPPLQQIFLFEQLLLDGNTHSVNVTPKLKLNEVTTINMTAFNTSARHVDNRALVKTGVLDKLSLEASYITQVGLQRLELIAHPVELLLYVNGKQKRIPGRFQNDIAEMYFEIYPYLQEALYSKFIIHRFVYDINPGANEMVFKLDRVGETTATLLTTSAATRTEGEVHMSWVGRPTALTIECDVFSGGTPIIYRLEIELEARRGLTYDGNTRSR